jgi:8-oxo-dGTP diphosphatase
LEQRGILSLRVAAAVVWREGRLLLTRRPAGGPHGPLWELPGGKIEAGETPEAAVLRELREELGVAARPVAALETVHHRYPHGLEVEIVFIHCELESYDLIPGMGVSEIRWWGLDELDLEQVLAADRPFLAALRRKASGTRG